MHFSRSFQLKPYWQEWKEARDRERSGMGTETEMLKIKEFPFAFGGQSVTVPPEAVSLFLEETLQDIYHRKRLALKIFDSAPLHPDTDMHDAFWGKYERNNPGHLVETSKIQNFFAAKDLAPRVYDLIFLKEETVKYAAQATDFVSGDRLFDPLDEEYFAALSEIGQYSGKIATLEADITPNNFKDGKLLDFQRFTFQPAFRPRLMDRIRHGIGFGDETPYQGVEELHIEGKRANHLRNNFFAKAIKEDKKILPPNFTVLDMGCNGGYFLRRAMDWGAGWGVGVDKEGIIKVACEVGIYFGYFNLDYFDTIPSKTFDLAFFLSMSNHFPFEEFVPHVGKILYFEGHAAHTEESCRALMNPHFKEITLLGSVDDFPGGNQPRLLFRAVR